MYEEFNETTKMMLNALDNELQKAHDGLKRVKNDQEAKMLRARIAMLKKQKEQAMQPVKRTPEEVKRINKIAEQVKKGVEADMAAVKGTRADKKLTPIEEFEYKLKTYVNEMSNRVVEMEKVLASYTEIASVLKEHTPVNEEGIYNKFVEDILTRIEELKNGIITMKEKVASSDENIKALLENFELLQKMNKFLNNPLGLSE